MKTIIMLFLIILTSANILAQKNSRNGLTFPPNGTIRFFVVFAEAVGDPKDPGSKSNWTAGQMPTNPRLLFPMATKQTPGG